MKMRISEEDAARIGVPRDLTFDPTKLMGRELITMERVTKWSYEALMDALGGRPVVNAIGQPVWETEEDGVTRKKDGAGNPIQVVGFDLEAVLVVVWLAARRINGPDVAWESIDLDINGIEWVEDEDPGKESNRAARRSKTNTTTTKRRSVPSSA